MKKIFKLGIGIIALIAVSSSNTQAAFPIKQVSNTATETTLSANPSNVTLNTNENELLGSTLSATQSTETKAKSAAIPKGLYILLAVFGLGWLAMGINSDFEGYDWLISLLLYFLFWLPGFIYTLIKMKNYY